ncbi:MAG: succinylglutamate desuccinylase/aspartoacylase family protein [Pseudomonadota bacterium]
MSETRIRCFIDFERDGKQISHLQLPHSSNISAYGWIGIPICVIRNGTGPTLYLGAGNHGDEYEGQIVLSHLIRDLDPATIQGRLIIMPATNFPAAMAGSRCSPIDDGNLNRSFPGDADGTPTEAIAHFLESVLMPLCDALVDLHSGGKTLDYLPSALARRPPYHDPLAAQKRAAIEAFRAPYAFVAADAREDRTIIAGADRVGIVSIGTELGGAGTVTRETLSVTRRGVTNLLRHFGLMEGALEGPLTQLTEVGGAEYYVHAPCRGLFEPTFELGDQVEAGQLAGLIHFMDDPAAQPREVRFEAGGLAICRRPILQVERGDCLGHLATDLSD